MLYLSVLLVNMLMAGKRANPNSFLTSTLQRTATSFVTQLTETGVELDKDFIMAEQKLQEPAMPAELPGIPLPPGVRSNVPKYAPGSIAHALSIAMREDPWLKETTVKERVRAAQKKMRYNSNKRGTYCIVYRSIAECQKLKPYRTVCRGLFGNTICVSASGMAPV
jgi:hypothetical protein